MDLRNKRIYLAAASSGSTTPDRSCCRRSATTSWTHAARQLRRVPPSSASRPTTSPRRSCSRSDAVVEFLQNGMARASCRWRTCGTASPSATRRPRTASPTWRRSTSASPCTSSESTSGDHLQGLRERRGGVPHGPSSAPSRASPSAAYWTSRAGVRCRGTSSSLTTSTRTRPRAPTGAPRGSSRPARGVLLAGIGVRYRDSKWFRGRDTREHSVSTCPDPSCCRRAPEDLATRWSGHSWPSARTHAHLLAALPPGAFPGVDETEVYQFLHAHHQQ